MLRYTKEWERYVTRQARWVDFENDYKTLNLDYMESVMWAFKSLYDKGLVYEGFSVLAYCWRCETPLSNHELRMDDDTYAERQDPSVTVRFKLETGEWLLAWTTTPWTLPSNLALAVGPDVEYAVLERDGEKAYVGEARLGELEFGERLPEHLAASDSRERLVERRQLRSDRSELRERLVPHPADGGAVAHLVETIRVSEHERPAKQIQHVELDQVAGEVRLELPSRVVENGRAVVRESLAMPEHAAEPVVGGHEAKRSDWGVD